MESIQLGDVSSSVRDLLEAKAASRIQAKDATLYAFSDEAEACAQNFMGWTDLAENPPYPLKKVKKLAKRFIKDKGIKAAVLIGQGGSTQASMALTKFFKEEHPAIAFYILDSDSPVRLRETLSRCNLKKTLVIVSSKSGGTLEMRSMLAAVRSVFLEVMDEHHFCQRLVAITDPGSPLQEQARSEGWAAVLPGEPTVGGRFSALSVFGLFPAALVGIPLGKLMSHAVKMEKRCGEDSSQNPAIQLASFLFDNFQNGRNKVALVMPKRVRALGLWIEQLLAESTGKQGKGILPYLEVNPLLLAQDQHDRVAVTFHVPSGTADDQASFDQSIACINKDIPCIDFSFATVEDLAEQFVLWEYATALCGWLMKICPFDQPDVASAKACVGDILKTGLPAADFIETFAGEVPMGSVEARLSPCCDGATTTYDALFRLLKSIKPGDYFAINAFVPFAGDRKMPLEAIRSAVAERTGVPSCLEVGPRYLHSTGQLQKGGPNQGVFLVISAQEAQDVVLEGQSAESLGALAQAQAVGDAATLTDRGRRCLHLHLPGNYGVTLGLLAALVRQVLDDLEKEATQA